MKKSLVTLFAVIAVISFAIPCTLKAEEQKFELKSDYSIKEILKAKEGKKIAITTADGAQIEGTVAKIGDSLVHISGLTGKEFYDAVVRIDGINSIVFRAK